MNIKFENNSIKTEFFRDIIEGDCFIADYNTPHQAICIKTFSGGIEGNVNAVDLQSGENYNFGKKDVVVPLNAELKVWLLDQ